MPRTGHGLSGTSYGVSGEGKTLTSVPIPNRYDQLALLFDWVENNNAPDTIEGTKFVSDKQANGISFTRRHCRFPYRTTYSGSGDSNDPDNWTCEFIDNWQDCDGSDGNLRLC